MSYWVYEKWRAQGHRATVHLGERGHCNHGHGQQGGTRADNGRWLGPFSTAAGAHGGAALYVDGEHPHNWHQHFRTWRRRRLSALAVERSDKLDEVAEFLVDIGTKIRELGPKGYFLSHSFEEGDDPNAGMVGDEEG